MIYITLFIEFFKVGILTVGGGLASLPFLYEMANKFSWFDGNILSDMIAISQSTPGPIGINMATFVGYNVGGVLGSLAATFGFVFPSFLIILILFKVLSGLINNSNGILKLIRPCVCGLISVAWFELLKDLFNDTNVVLSIILFLLMFYIIKTYDKHPIIYILLGAVLGILFKI